MRPACLPGPPSPAFTLIELVAVIVVLAVLAGLAVPRLMATGDRRGQAEVDAVAALLTQAARRQMLTTQRVAVEYDAERRMLAVVSLRPADASTFDGRERRWARDPLLPDVVLEAVEVASASSNAAALDPRRFRAELSDSGGRVSFTIGLRDGSGRSEWTVTLPLAGDRAIVAPGRDAGASRAAADTIDLDVSGRRDSPW